MRGGKCRSLGICGCRNGRRGHSLADCNLLLLVSEREKRRKPSQLAAAEEEGEAASFGATSS